LAGGAGRLAKLSKSITFFEVLATVLETVEKEVSGVSKAAAEVSLQSLTGDLKSESKLLDLNLCFSDVSC
jgi:hypothetical protein